MMKQDEKIYIIWSNCNDTRVEEYPTPELAESRLIQLERMIEEGAMMGEGKGSHTSSGTKILHIIKGIKITAEIITTVRAIKLRL